VVIELRVVQLCWSDNKLAITNHTPAMRSCDFVYIARLISDQIALHSVQLPLFKKRLLLFNSKKLQSLSLSRGAVMEVDKLISSLFPFEQDESFIWIAVYCIEAAFIMIINIITIIIFVKCKTYFGRAVYMLINLAASDALYGCSIFAICVYFRASVTEKFTVMLKIRAILEAVVILTLFISGTSLVMVALDRPFATVAPFRYRVLETHYYSILVGCQWSLCVGLALVHYFLPTEYAYILVYPYVIANLLFLTIIIVSYIVISIKVRSQGQLTNRTAQAVQQREKNMAYTLMIVTFCSLSTWLPIGIVFTVHQGTDIQVSEHISACAFLIQVSNSLINPLIYAFRIGHFRKVFIRSLTKCSYQIGSVGDTE